MIVLRALYLLLLAIQPDRLRPDTSIADTALVRETEGRDAARPLRFAFDARKTFTDELE
jgi:hypothetical protein